MRKLILFLFCALWPSLAWAQDQRDPASEATRPAAEATTPAEPQSFLFGGAAADAAGKTPRESYNDALNALEGSLWDEAILGFLESRDKAGYDNALRYAAAYNLGYSYAQKVLAQGEPSELKSEALRAMLSDLEQAAAWFRDAVRQRPSLREARENLEIVLAQILNLQDLLQQKERGLERQIMALMTREAQIREAARRLSEHIEEAKAQRDPIAFEEAFREIAKSQRETLTEANAVAELAQDEFNRLNQQDEASLSDEDKYRKHQLRQVQPLLEQARQSMARTRRQLRTLAIQDSLRLSAQAFYQLRQAREQLLEPLAILQALLGDQSQSLRLIEQKAQLQALGTAEEAKRAWLNPEYLGDAQADVQVRTRRIEALFKAMLTAMQSDEAKAKAKDAEKLENYRAQMQDALPLLGEAIEAMQKSQSEIAAAQWPAAQASAKLAEDKLFDAVERFANLRQLIEILYMTQQGVSTETGLFSQKTPEKEEDGSPSVLPGLLENSLDKNLARIERLAVLFAKEAAKLSEGQPGQAAPNAEQLQAQRQLFEEAERLRQSAKKALEAAKRELEKLPNLATANTAVELLSGGLSSSSNLSSSISSSNSNASLDAEQTVLAEQRAAYLNAQERALWQNVHQHSKNAEKALEELRILFFSLIEHIEELGRQQEKTQLQTEALASQTESDEALALKHRQDEHEERATTLASILQEQAQKALQNAQQGQLAQPQTSQLSPEDQAQRLREASDELKLAATAMRQVSSDLQAQTPELQEALEGQSKALEHIAKALEILKPPQEQNQEEKQEQEQEQGQSKEEQQESKPEQQREMSQEETEKKIQQIRSREQERRRRLEERKAAGGLPYVEKDW